MAYATFFIFNVNSRPYIQNTQQKTKHCAACNEFVTCSIAMARTAKGLHRSILHWAWV